MTHIKKNTYTIVIPAYNEDKHIDAFFRRLKASSFEVSPSVLVNDGSVDTTVSVASKYTPYVLNHATNLGKGAALKTGCDFAFTHLKANYVIMMDSDEQHSPNDLLKFIDKIGEGHELILGVRSFNGMPTIPTYLNKFTSFMIQLLYGTYVPDVPSGYKAISRKMYDEIKWQATGYEVEVEIAQKIARKKIKFATVPIETIYPDYVRGMTLLDGVKVLLKLIGIK